MKFQTQIEKALGFLLVLAVSLAALYWLTFRYVWPVTARREGAVAAVLIIAIGLFVWWRIKTIANNGGKYQGE